MNDIPFLCFNFLFDSESIVPPNLHFRGILKSILESRPTPAETSVRTEENGSVRSKLGNRLGLNP